MMISPVLFLGKSSLRATTKSTHGLLHLPPDDCILLEVCQHLSHWSVLTTCCLAQWCLTVSLCSESAVFVLSLVHLHCLLQHDVEEQHPARVCSEESTCRRKNFVLCYHSSFPRASSFELGSLYRTLQSSTQAFVLFCIGNALGMRSRGMFSLPIGKYVITWIRQTICIPYKHLHTYKQFVYFTELPYNDGRNHRITE